MPSSRSFYADEIFSRPEFGRNFAHAFASELFRVLVDVLLCAPNKRRIREVENELLL